MGLFRGFVNWSEVGRTLVLGKTVALWAGPRLVPWQPLKLQLPPQATRSATTGHLTQVAFREMILFKDMIWSAIIN